MNDDVEHLRLLTIFHYVLAAVVAALALLPAIPMAFGVAMLLGKVDPPEPGARIAGGCMVVVAGIFVVLGLSFAALLALTGSFLAQRRHYTFCLVMAALLAMLFMPLGTLLGILTIVVLVRDPVKVMFGQTVPARVHPEP